MMNLWTRRAGAALLALLIALPLAAADAAARKKPWEKFDYPPLGKITMPDYERVQLDNGMVVYLAEDHELPLVELSATIRAGSIYDPPGKVGLGSVCGTVLRSGGTESLTGDELDELVESKGMVLETWVDQVNGGAYLSTLPEDADRGVELLADVLRRPAFAQDKLDIAKKQQTAAISRRNDEPMTIARREAVKAILGADHPLARQTEYATIDAIGRDDLVAYHDRFFRPDYTYLVVIGDFDRDRMLETVRRRFGDWEASGRPLPPDPEMPDLPRTVNVAAKDDLTQSTVVLGHVGIRADDPNYAAIEVANRILGGGFSSRLFNEVRSKRGYAYSVGSMSGTGLRFPGVFVATCGTKSSTTDDAIAVILDQIKRMTEEPVTDEELAQARDAILNSEVFNYDTKREILDRLVTYEMYGYSPDFLQKYLEQVREMTPQKVMEAAAAVWHPDRMTIFVVGNPKEWDADLSAYGPVNDVDITIPAPDAGLEVPAATPESLARGQELMAAAAQAVGGDELAGLKGWHEKTVLEAEIQGMPMKITIDKTVQLPDRERIVQELPFGKMTVILNPDGAWAKSPMGDRELPADQVARSREELESELLSLLKDRAELQCQALEPAELQGQACDRVHVTGAGSDYVLLYLDPESHLPLGVQTPGEAPMTQTPVTQVIVLSDYGDLDGLKLPRSFVVLHDGEQFATGTTTEFEANPAVEEALFQP